MDPAAPWTRAGVGAEPAQASDQALLTRRQVARRCFVHFLAAAIAVAICAPAGLQLAQGTRSGLHYRENGSL